MRCALEIAKALKNHPEIHVRMGIHSGPVNEVSDLNEQANIAGAGINMAQRVMDCADAGHILLSKRVAEDLEHYSRWRSLLHDLGECEVKHGLRVSIVNLYGDEAGNSELPEKFRRVKAKGQTTREATPAKSVAVLPFVNMSADKHDEYLSDGMTEELINALARYQGCECRDGHLVSLSRARTKQIFSERSVISCMSIQCWKEAFAKLVINCA